MFCPLPSPSAFLGPSTYCAYYAGSAFRWVVRSRKFDRGGEVWEGEVVPAHDPEAEPRAFSSREDLAALLAA